jgi:DNA (cytosine-5)-methyltransferase 1
MYLKKRELPPLKVISLFSGYGAGELALNRLNVNFECVAHCDIEENANEVFKLLHYPTYGNLGDITLVDEKTMPNCDLLTISSPCQDISIAGMNKGVEIGTRSGLLLETERIIEHLKPKYILFENVRNLSSNKHIHSLNKFIRFLNSIGYGCYWSVINASDFGVPQNRERVYMMCVLGESNEEVKEKMMKVDSLKFQQISLRHFLDDHFDESLIINSPFKEFSSNGKCKVVAMRTDTNYSQCARIISLDGVAPCLTTANQIQILTEEGVVRKLSVRERYRLMGLNEEEIDRILYCNVADTFHFKLTGNSIVVNVLEAIFKQFFQDYIQNPTPVTNYFWSDLKMCA